MRSLILSAMLIMVFSGCSPKTPPPESPMAKKIKRFAPTRLPVDLTHLPAGERRALAKLVDAAKLMTRLYMRQVWSGNEELFARLQTDSTADAVETLQLFSIELSPWSSLDHNEPFIAGVPMKPAGANYYPEDMAKEEFEKWVTGLSPADRAKATGFFHVIRRKQDRSLMMVPYSEEYRDILAPAATLLREAADLTEDPTLRKFLRTRADAFQSNEYFQSDVAWMELDSPIEPTIGPYETYLDELLNYKAAFEAFITLRNNEETTKLEKFSGYLQEIENNLPIDPGYRNPKIGALSPIRVVDEVFVGGEAASGVQTAAFNLPNDERVIREKGSKRVMLRNVQEAKFQTVLLPIARVALNPAQLPGVTFDSFFTHILVHELMHGLGPHNITVKGKQSTVRKELKELYSPLEEAKADISALFALQYLMEKGAVDNITSDQLYVTYLAGAFRSVRFGVNEAHGKGMALQFNYLFDEGAFQFDEKNGRFTVNTGRIADAVRKLTAEIMTIQAEGNGERAKALLQQYGVIRPPMQRVLDNLQDIPVDISPVFDPVL